MRAQEGKFLTVTDIRRVIVSGAFVLAAFCIVPTISNRCWRDDILERLSAHRPAEPMPACTETESGFVCSIGFGHCYPSMVDELITLVAIVAACLFAGALASRGSTPNAVRGAAAVGLGAAIVVGIEGYRFGMTMTGALVLVGVPALLGLAGGYAAKRRELSRLK